MSLLDVLELDDLQSLPLSDPGSTSMLAALLGAFDLDLAFALGRCAADLAVGFGATPAALAFGDALALVLAGFGLPPFIAGKGFLSVFTVFMAFITVVTFISLLAFMDFIAFIAFTALGPVRPRAIAIAWSKASIYAINTCQAFIMSFAWLCVQPACA